MGKKEDCRRKAAEMGEGRCETGRRETGRQREIGRQHGYHATARNRTLCLYEKQFCNSVKSRNLKMGQERRGQKGSVSVLSIVMRA